MSAEEFREQALQRADDVAAWAALASATVVIVGGALLLIVTAVAIKELWGR